VTFNLNKHLTVLYILYYENRKLHMKTACDRELEGGLYRSNN